MHLSTADHSGSVTGVSDFLLEIANQQIFAPSSFLVSGTSFWSDKLQGDIEDYAINSGKNFSSSGWAEPKPQWIPNIFIFNPPYNKIYISR